MIKNKTLCLLLLININLASTAFSSSSLKFEEKIKKQCGIVFQNSVGITFSGETPTQFSDVILYSNDPKNDEINLRVTKLLKATNLLRITNSDIYLVFNGNNKLKLSSIGQSTISLKRGKHKVHLEINKPRTDIFSGLASLEFEIHTICK